MTQVIDARPAPGPARWGPRVRKLVRFGVVGVASTVAYALLYLLFRQALDAFVANTLALLITAVANTAVNRRVTSGSPAGTACSATTRWGWPPSGSGSR